MRRVKKGGPSYNELFFSKTYEFLNLYLVRQSGKSECTRKSYRFGLGGFYEYVTKVLGFSPMLFTFIQCSYDLLLKYSQFLQEKKKLKATTINARLAAIRSYLAYVSDEDTALISVFIAASRIPTLTVSKEQRPIIEARDLPVFLDSPAHTRIGNRDRFILILLFDSAIRVGELIHLTLGDLIMVSDGNSSILVHGKGRKERCITLSEKADAHLHAYLAVYHKESKDPSRPLVYTTAHSKINQMSARNVERILRKYGNTARESAPNIPETYPHMIRRTRATTLYRDGVPLEQVSALLGHQQIETTRTHYAFPSVEQLRNTVNRGSGQEPDTAKEWIGHEAEIRSKFGL